MIYNDKDFSNTLVDFFAGLNELGKLFAESLENYSKENYDEVESISNQSPAEDCDCNECDCVQCAGKEPKETPKNTETIHEAYELFLEDYSVDNIEKAQKTMAPKLNSLTFAMRCSKFSFAEIHFKFTGVSYDFYWDAENDRFSGTESNPITSHNVYWHELTNEVRYFDMQYDNEKAETTEIPVEDPEPGCRYKNEAFYPDGEKCKNCPDRDKCYTDIKEVKTDEKAKSAIYNDAGELIDEQEIPSLKDYTTGNTSVVVEESPKESKCIPLETLDEEHTNNLCELNNSLCKERPAASEVVSIAQALYDRINKKFDVSESNYIKLMLDAVQYILDNDMFDIFIDPASNKINQIRFSLGLVTGAIKTPMPENILDKIHLTNFINEMKTRFGFKSVTFNKDNFYCELV